MGELKLLKKSNDQQEAHLKEEDKQIISDIIIYLSSAGLAEENLRQDLIEMAFSARERGENLKMAIGKDYKEFSDEIAANLPKKTGKEKFTQVVGFLSGAISIMLFLSTLCISNFILILRKHILGEPASWDISYPVGLLVLVVGSVFLILLWGRHLTKKSFELTREMANLKPNKAKDVASGCLGVMIAVGMVVVAGVADMLFKHEVVTLNLFTGVVIMISTYLLHKWIEWKE